MTRAPELRQHIRRDLPRELARFFAHRERDDGLITTRIRCFQTGSILVFLFLLCGAEIRFWECVQRFLPGMGAVRPVRERLNSR